MEFDFKAIEEKWAKYWQENGIDKFDEKNIDNKYYVLEMFSYPSAATLHAGHWFNYACADTFARYKKMKGKNLFQPMGFDAFGLPAENYAIKTGIHPQDSTLKNIEKMIVQLKKMGAMIDWDYTLETCSENYYKWTQWLFLQLYKKGLAYRKEAPVNFCTSCQTVIANEQVVDGCCERCGHEVIQKKMTQWFLKITDYAQELLNGLDDLDWPENTKTLQRNWIGKSNGAEAVFKTESGKDITVFTTRLDTIFGVSFVVIAPENKLVDELTTLENKEKMQKYLLESSKKNEIVRLSTENEKTGCFTGSYCINPVNNKKVPIFVGDYVVGSYGTGAVMGVAAHDTRDYDFAKKYNLDIIRVINGENGNDNLPFVEDGILTNSEKFSGQTSEIARKNITESLKESGLGRAVTNFRLRDWLVSRQRYWGAPIPIIHCEKCGEVPVLEKDLPVKLPYDVEFKPTGLSPLASHSVFINCKCPVCGGNAKRDADTLDTFVCSSWYYLRYPDNKNSAEPFNSKKINKILPVDKYVGGKEHACMHLLYARFITRALFDMGYINFKEPFKSLVHQGTILGSDGNKMSKSKGNTVTPDVFVDEFGADCFRLYLLFGFNFIQGGPWSDDGVSSSVKFVERVARIVKKVSQMPTENENLFNAEAKELEYAVNYAIKNVEHDLEIFSFNTAVARVMELVNAIYKYDNLQVKNTVLLKDVCKKLALIVAPMMPHIAEELNLWLGNKESVFKQNYPVADESKLIKNEVEIVVQINNKIKTKLNIDVNSTEEDVVEIVSNMDLFKDLFKTKSIKKHIYIKNKLLNLIV